MRNEEEGRIWAEHRKDIGDAFDGLIAAGARAFEVLHRLQWSAPWATPGQDQCRCDGKG